MHGTPTSDELVVRCLTEVYTTLYTIYIYTSAQWEEVGEAGEEESEGRKRVRGGRGRGEKEGEGRKRERKKERRGRKKEEGEGNNTCTYAYITFVWQLIQFTYSVQTRMQISFSYSCMNYMNQLSFHKIHTRSIKVI